MNGKWAGCLSLSLSILVANAHGEEIQWRPAGGTAAKPAAASGVTSAPPAAVSLGRPVAAAPASAATLAPPVATLARPVPMKGRGDALVDRQVQPASFSPGKTLPPRLVRAQGPDGAQPMPEGLPMPHAVNPQSPPELYNQGVVTDRPVIAGPSMNGSGPIVMHESNCDGGLCDAQGCCDGCDMGCCGDDCCGGGCCCAEGEANCFWLRAEYLLWWLRDTKVPPLVTGGSPADARPATLGQPNTVVLFGGTIDSEARSGGRFTAGIWLDPCQIVGIEGVFFFLQERTVNFNSNMPTIGRPFFNVNTGLEDVEYVANPNLPQVGVDPLTGRVTVDLRSNIWGAEANGVLNCCRGCWGTLDFLAGARYIQLDESLNINENLLVPAGAVLNPPGTRFLVSDRFATQNQFYGGQIGGRTKYLWGNFDVELQGKIALGVTHQNVDIDGNFTQVSPAGVAQTARGGLLTGAETNIGTRSRDRFSVVPEVNVNLGYQFHPNLRAFVGYTFLYWSEVARPGDQIDRVVNPNRVGIGQIGNPAANTGPFRPAFDFNSGSFWAHGASAGLEFKY